MIGSALVARIGLATNLLPRNRIGAEIVIEPGDFATGSWQHTQKRAMLTGDELHVSTAGQFGVTHVPEVRVAHELTQVLPGFLMHFIIRGVARVEMEMDGGRVIGTNDKRPNELFEIGAVVLVVAKGDVRCRIVRRGTRTVTKEGNGRGVLVELRHINVKGADDMQDDGGKQGSLRSLEQEIEVTANAIVVEERKIGGLQAKAARDKGAKPLGNGIQRLTRQEDVANENEENLGRSNGGLTAWKKRRLRQVFGQ